MKQQILGAFFIGIGIGLMVGSLLIHLKIYLDNHAFKRHFEQRCIAEDIGESFCYCISSNFHMFDEQEKTKIMDEFFTPEKVSKKMYMIIKTCADKYEI